MGNTNKSPEDWVSPIIFFANSTPINPPNNPPIMVLVLSNAIRFSGENSITGFSKKPTNRDPIKAPSAAPRMIDSRLLDEMASLFFRRNSR